ncbi:MAG: hypothetical protein QM666_00895 [Acinetobacter sp.]
MTELNEKHRLTWDQLEKICIGLFGESWQAELARRLDIDRRTVQHWRKQGVAKWVYNEIAPLIECRKGEILEIEKFYKSL